MRIWTILLFIIVNLAVSSIAAFLMVEGISEEWYENLQKAPWTPPNDIFGIMWTLILLCYGVFMGLAYYTNIKRKKLIILFSLHWIFNVSWNYFFLSSHQVLIGFGIIFLLLIILLIFVVDYFKVLKIKTLFILPYILWLLVSCSLHLYIYAYN